jgi:hypothetical protein
MLEPPNAEEAAELRGYWAREAGTPRTKNEYKSWFAESYQAYELKKRLLDAWRRGWDLADKWIDHEKPSS